MSVLEKECFKCGAIKPLTSFYKHLRMSDGRLNKCKQCTRSDVSKNRKENIDYYREYDRKRGSRTTYEATKSYRENNPVKYKAHNAVNNAIRDGRLLGPLPCEVCLNTHDLHAHHDDYSKPLEIRWLCAKHHKEWHMNNEAKGI